MFVVLIGSLASLVWLFKTIFGCRWFDIYAQGFKLILNSYCLLLMYVLFSTCSMENLIILHNRDPIVRLITHILISFTLLFYIMKRCNFQSRFYKERYQPVQYRFVLSLHILTSHVCVVEEANDIRRVHKSVVYTLLHAWKLSITFSLIMQPGKVNFIAKAIYVLDLISYDNSI